MSKLKEWYVQLERVKGSNMDYMNYLLDGRRHKGQEITPDGRVHEKVKALETDREIWHENMKRGGHIPSSAYSLLISFPFALTTEQWYVYNREVLKEFFEMVLKEQVPDYDEELIESLIDRSVMVTHKHEHTHFMLPKILNDKKIVLNFTRKRYSYMLKNIVNKKLETNFNISKFDYEVEESKKKLPLRLARTEKYEADTLAIAEGKVAEEIKDIIDALKVSVERIKSQGGNTTIVEKTMKKILSLNDEGKTRKALRMAKSEKKKSLKEKR